MSAFVHGGGSFPIGCKVVEKSLHFYTDNVTSGSETFTVEVGTGNFHYIVAKSQKIIHDELFGCVGICDLTKNSYLSAYNDTSEHSKSLSSSLGVFLQEATTVPCGKLKFTKNGTKLICKFDWDTEGYYESCTYDFTLYIF